VEDRLQEARRLYEAHCVAEGLPVVEPDAAPGPGGFAVCFRHVVDREIDQVLRHGRLSDLLVMARPGGEDEAGLSATFDAALFDSCRPVLLVPARPMTSYGATIAIAWDRSREAARAVAAGLPLLAKADKIVILTAREAGSDTEPSELASYLALHGIEARTWAFTPGPGSLSEALLAEAEKAEADLVVMGAYGHSRLREMVLGGVTHGVLADAVIPVLMVH
jgi:nucleotide-binding universal stress UspA family protein